MRFEISESESGAGGRRGLLALCLVVGAAVMVQGAARLPCISRDGVFFVEYAQKLATEPLVQLRGQTKQPGYSILLLGLHSLIGRSISENAAVSWEVCGQIIAVLGGVAVVGLIYLVTRRLFDARTGLIAALLAAFWPQLVTVSSDVLSDAPHLALYLGGLLLGLRAMEGKRRNEEDESADGADKRSWGMQNSDLRFQNGGMQWGALIACGAVCGVAYLLRQEALGAVAAVCVCLLWPPRGARRRTAGLEDSACPTLRRRVARAAVVMAAFVVVVAPYSIAVGKVMPNKSIRDLLWGAEETETADGADGHRWGEKNQNAPPRRVNSKSKSRNGECRVAGADECPCKSQISNLKSQSAGPVTWWDAPIKMLGGWSRSGRYVLSTLALAGFFWWRSGRSDPGVRRLVFVAALLQIIAAQARGMQYWVVSERYLMIPAALAIPWSAAGLVAIAKYAGERFGRQGRRPLLVAALMAIAPMAYYDLRPAALNADWQRQLGNSIKNRSGLARLFTSNRRDWILAGPQLSPLCFYSGLERVWPAEEGFESFINRLPATQPVWFADHPNLHRLTEREHRMLEQCRIYIHRLKLEGWWLPTEAGEVVRVYKLNGTLAQKTPP